MAGTGTDMGVRNTTRYITKLMEDMRAIRFEGAKSRRVKVLPIDIYRVGVPSVIGKRERSKACQKSRVGSPSVIGKHERSKACQ